MKWVTYEPNRRLSSVEIDASQHCPICGYTGRRDRRRVIQKEPHILLLFCPRCFGLSASQMPKREVMDTIYKSYYEQHKQERVIFSNSSRLARHIVSMIEVSANGSDGVRITDFGGGDGSISLKVGALISAQTQRLIRVQVVDYVEESPVRRGSVNIEYVRELRDSHQDCDLIIASAVFEHIPDLALVLPELIGKLRIGGALYARTAFNLPLMRLFGLDMNYPAHVHDLGDEFWGNLPKWLSVPVEIVRSGPGIVETGFRKNFIRTAAAYCLKLPSRIECLWTRHPIFKLYGGWEVVMRRIA
jgi:hypothetical protein